MSQMNEGRIEAGDVRVRYGATQILHGVDFTAEAGQLTVIVGPNGSGKTTLMRALTGEIPATGDISINRRALATMKPWELAATRAVLAQAATLSFPFTVREVVELGLTSGWNGRRAASGTMVDEALTLVDLGGFAGRFYQQLSGGEQQRVQFARVLTQIWNPVGEEGPRWLFLDEPVSSLDIRHQLQIMNIARNYAARGGGVIAVMHDLNLTAMFADRIAMMHGGRCAAAGTPGEALRDDLLAEVFGCRLRVGATPPAGTTFVLPHSAA